MKNLQNEIEKLNKAIAYEENAQAKIELEIKRNKLLIEIAK